MQAQSRPLRLGLCGRLLLRPQLGSELFSRERLVPLWLRPFRVGFWRGSVRRLCDLCPLRGQSLEFLYERQRGGHKPLIGQLGKGSQAGRRKRLVVHEDACWRVVLQGKEPSQVLFPSRESCSIMTISCEIRSAAPFVSPIAIKSMACASCHWKRPKSL